MRSRWAQEADSLYTAGDLVAARAVAQRGLEEEPGDIDSLRIAGRCSLEIDSADATEYLGRLVALAPEDVDAQLDLGRALVGDGRLSEAAQAFRQVLAARAGDVTALVNLAHVSYALGEKEDARTLLTEAVHSNPVDAAARRSLVEMLMAFGEVEAALDVLRAAPEPLEDLLDLLNLADLHLAVGAFDAALAVYQRLRELDEPHELYAWHGMIEVEIRRERWRRALDLAIQATRLDRYDLTTELLAYVARRLFGDGDRPGHAWQDLQSLLASERAEHRRMHAEELVW